MEGAYNVLVSIGKLWLCRLLNRHGAADAADLAWRLADRTGPCEAKIRQLGLNSLSGPFFFGRCSFDRLFLGGTRRREAAAWG